MTKQFATKDALPSFPMTIDGGPKKLRTLSELDIILISAKIWDKLDWFIQIIDNVICDKSTVEVCDTLSCPTFLVKVTMEWRCCH